MSVYKYMPYKKSTMVTMFFLLNNVFHCFGTMITVVTMVDGNLDNKKHGYHGNFL